ncbi:histone-lysine N-methyltransferase set-1-like [Mercenaria mercenaria]|uniref:histone-lysine N-methyltransferase set-1-like n=1 Tax=Mercenaria mercenaria TaxID=6596 RepID=UPI001E1DB523|nr:histone-lysine N-methyltransferase set-1-like [Mercenaria mercenaria]
MRPKRQKPIEMAASFIEAGKDPPDYVMEVIPPKGRGVKTKVNKQQHDFILNYYGDLITGEEGEKREKDCESTFRYFFKYQGKDWCP